MHGVVVHDDPPGAVHTEDEGLVKSREAVGYPLAFSFSLQF